MGDRLVIVSPVPHPRLFVRLCSCGFQASSPTAQGVVDAMMDHLRAAHMGYAMRVES